MNVQGRQIQHIPNDLVYASMHTKPEGLSAEEVNERLLHVGKNTLDIPDKGKFIRSFIKQFTSFFTILLIVSALICFVAHRINPEESMNILGWALLGVSLLNAFFSFIQEYRAERAMEALRKFLPQLVEVYRDGAIHEIPADEIVPGDVLQISEGNRMPADARIVECNGLMVDNAPLTGESNPQRLTKDPVNKRLSESENIAFAGCSVVRGMGKGVVFATGLRTEFGKLAHLSQEIKRERSPLERETAHMIRVLTVIAVLMGGIFFFYGFFHGRSLWVNLVFMMGIIVANVPEGLLPTFTLSLAMGSLRMARKSVLVKSLASVEALGAVHVICSDKTGTLTENRLTIAELADPQDGSALEESGQHRLLAFALCASEVRATDSGFTGDPLDVAVAQKFLEKGGKFTDIKEKTIMQFAFDVKRRRSGGILAEGTEKFFVVKGAFEAIRPMITGIESLSNSDSQQYEVYPADEQKIAAAEEALRNMAQGGLRVIVVAYRPLVGEKIPEQQDEETDSFLNGLEHDLILCGFIGIEDPLRPEVPEAVEKCHRAGIDVIMITGDHPETALAIAYKGRILSSGQGEGTLLTGDVLDRLSQDQLTEKLRQGVRVFARTTPEQKMKIVAALKTMDKVVAMTGDGVNDAPALKAADIGIAMGKQGTDVARESAQIILLDDNFASIVAGIEEGRTVFDNIKKFTNYVLVSNGPEILPYLLYIMFPVPLALNVIHILSIDLGTDIIPSMGLGQEPPDPETMQKPPRDNSQGLLTVPLICHSYLFLGLLEGGWSLFLFFYVLHSGGWRYGETLASSDPVYRSAMGIALATILLMQIGNLVGRRFTRRAGLDRGIFSNKLILLGIFVQIVFSWATLYFPPIQKVLNTGPVAGHVFLLAWLGVVIIFGSDYLRKLVMNKLRPEGDPFNKAGTTF